MPFDPHGPLLKPSNVTGIFHDNDVCENLLRQVVKQHFKLC